MKKKTVALLAACWFLAAGATPASALCNGTFFDFISNVDYEAMFPMKLGAMTIDSGSDENAACNVAETEILSTSVCSCIAAPPVGLGLNFWWIGRLIETVKDAYCSPLLGTSLSSSSSGELNGGTDEPGSGGHAAGGTFAQGHEYTFPFGYAVSKTLGGACKGTNSDPLSTTGIDLLRMTELEYWWQDDSTAAFMQPEAFLFANPIASLACIPDKAMALFCGGFDVTYWCSWDEVYPMTGHDSNPNITEANANIAARLWFSGGRTGLMYDHAVDSSGCMRLPTPIWIKSHYKWQIASPVAKFDSMTTGKTGLLWDSAKNPTFRGATDQYIWVLSWKESCCANSRF